MSLKMFRIGQLARVLCTSPSVLYETLSHADEYYSELLIIDPRKADKPPRRVFSPRGQLRRFQMLFKEKVLATSMKWSPWNHGGVPGRNILSNVRPHLKSKYIFTTDVSKFFPSNHRHRVLKLFIQHGCSKEIAQLCTRLCTFNHRLEQGLPTSPIISDQLMQTVDKRIAGFCKSFGLIYTRFVDDLTISGSFDLETSNISDRVFEVLKQSGYKANLDPKKTRYGKVEHGATITNLRFHNGKPDLDPEYLKMVEEELSDAAELGRGGEIQCSFVTKEQLLGKVRFIASVHSQRGKEFMTKIRSVNWSRFNLEAEARGYVKQIKRAIKKADLGCHTSEDYPALPNPSHRFVNG